MCSTDKGEVKEELILKTKSHDNMQNRLQSFTQDAATFGISKTWFWQFDFLSLVFVLRRLFVYDCFLTFEETMHSMEYWL